MRLPHRFAVFALVVLVPLASGCSKDVAVGAVISQSGAVASYGTKVKNGMDLAVDEVNAAGGFQGGVLQLIYKDDATNSDVGRQVVHELIEENDVPVIIGAISSTVTLNIADICEEEEVVLLSPTASVPEITEAGAWIFRNYPSDVLEGTAMARFARDLGLERVVVFAIDNEFGAGLRDVFTQQYTSKYREVIRTFDFDDENPAAFAAMVDEVKELAPDGIYIFAYLESFAELLKLIDAAGIDAVKMGSSSVVVEDLVRMAGAAAEDLVFTRSVFDVNSTDEVVSSFVMAYRARYGEAPDHYAANGYDAVKLLIEAMNIGGSSHPDDIRAGLLGLKQYPGAAGPTEFDENGDVVRYPRMFIIKGSEALAYEKFVEDGGSLLADD